MIQELKPNIEDGLSDLNSPVRVRVSRAGGLSELSFTVELDDLSQFVDEYPDDEILYIHWDESGAFMDVYTGTHADRRRDRFRYHTEILDTPYFLDPMPSRFLPAFVRKLRCGYRDFTDVDLDEFVESLYAAMDKRTIGDLACLLLRAGYHERPCRGRHSLWSHRGRSFWILLSGDDELEAKPYQIESVADAVRTERSSFPAKMGCPRAEDEGALASIPYTMLIEWSDEDGAYLASLPEFPRCRTHGETYEEAALHGREVLESLILTFRTEGWLLPVRGEGNSITNTNSRLEERVRVIENDLARIKRDLCIQLDDVVPSVKHSLAAAFDAVTARMNLPPPTPGIVASELLERLREEGLAGDDFSRTSIEMRNERSIFQTIPKATPNEQGNPTP